MGLRPGGDFSALGAAPRGIARDENPVASRSNSASCICPKRDETEGPFSSTLKAFNDSERKNNSHPCDHLDRTQRNALDQARRFVLNVVTRPKLTEHSDNEAPPGRDMLDSRAPTSNKPANRDSSSNHSRSSNGACSRTAFEPKREMAESRTNDAGYWTARPISGVGISPVNLAVALSRSPTRHG